MGKGGTVSPCLYLRRGPSRKGYGIMRTFACRPPQEKGSASGLAATTFLPSQTWRVAGACKRIFDIVLSFAGLLILSPSTSDWEEKFWRPSPKHSPSPAV